MATKVTKLQIEVAGVPQSPLTATPTEATESAIDMARAQGTWEGVVRRNQRRITKWVTSERNVMKRGGVSARYASNDGGIRLRCIEWSRWFYRPRSK